MEIVIDPATGGSRCASGSPPTKRSLLSLGLRLEQLDASPNHIHFALDAEPPLQPLDPEIIVCLDHQRLSHILTNISRSISLQLNLQSPSLIPNP
jgi:hypothetical protein